MDERDSINVRETLRTQGWIVIESEISALIGADIDRIRNIPIDGKTAEEIGTEYLSLRRHVDGLLDVLNAIHKHEQ